MSRTMTDERNRPTVYWEQPLQFLATGERGPCALRILRGRSRELACNPFHGERARHRAENPEEDFHFSKCPWLLQNRPQLGDRG